MTTGPIIPEKPGESERKGRIATWVATIFACVYIAWTGASLYYSTPIFLQMFTSMNLEWHTPILTLIAGYRWLYPVLFGGAAVLVVAKQYFVRENVVSLTITFVTTVVVTILSGAIVRAFYQPLFDMIEKLK